MIDGSVMVGEKELVLDVRDLDRISFECACGATVTVHASIDARLHGNGVRCPGCGLLMLNAQSALAAYQDFLRAVTAPAQGDLPKISVRFRATLQNSDE